MIAVSAEVVVVGAGSAGCIAALSAAQNGATVILVDRMGFPGGTSTAVLDTFYAFFTAGEAGRKVVAGVPDIPVQELERRGSVRTRPNSFGSGLGYTYDPEMLKIVWTGLLRRAGVKMLLHGIVHDVVIGREASVEAVLVTTKAGIVRIDSTSFVDASGDADVVARAGGDLLTDSDILQPATLTFKVSGLDVGRFKTEGRPQWMQLLERARADGLRLPGAGGSLHASGADGITLTALVRVPAPDLDDPFALGEADLEAVMQVDQWLAFLRDYVPGGEKSVLVSIAPTVGIRETRRIRARYTLEERDVLAGNHRDDQIALCGAPIEDLAAPTTRWSHVGGDGTYGVPWGSLLPATVRRVVVAGRCLGADHSAHASVRSMGTCMAAGQAAGTAAAWSARTGAPVDELDPAELRGTLRTQGAILDAVA